MTIPARMSVHDEDYNPLLARTLIIWLDGVPQTKVVSCDQKAGIICRYATDTEGKIIVRNGDAVVETLSGRVEVTVRKDG